MRNKDFHWTTDFFQPLILGGPCWVGTPLGHQLMETVRTLPFEPIFEELLPQLLANYAYWLPKDIRAFDEDFCLLIAVLYELCATAHPQTDSVFANAHDFAGHARMHLERLPNAQKAPDFVVRHLAVAPLFRLTRKKTNVHWWGGQKTFLGQKPDPLMLLWPKIRRVSIEEAQEDFWTALWFKGDEENRNARKLLIERLFLKSPLSLMVAAISDLPLTEMMLNPLLMNEGESQEDAMTPFILWEDPLLARSTMEHWLAHDPLKAVRILSFWLLNSLDKKNAHITSQRRCLEVFVYLLWSTLIMDKPYHENKMIWADDFWDISPKNWSEERLQRWGLLAWALEETELKKPFVSLQERGKEIYNKLLWRLNHGEIQGRKSELESVLQPIWFH